MKLRLEHPHQEGSLDLSLHSVPSCSIEDVFLCGSHLLFNSTSLGSGFLLISVCVRDIPWIKTLRVILCLPVFSFVVLQLVADVSLCV